MGNERNVRVIKAVVKERCGTMKCHQDSWEALSHVWIVVIEHMFLKRTAPGLIQLTSTQQHESSNRLFTQGSGV